MTETGLNLVTKLAASSFMQEQLLKSAFTFEKLTPRDTEEVRNLLRRNLAAFEEAGSVLAATFRRLENLGDVYSQEGCAMLVVRESENKTVVGCIGLGPLAGLPTSEGIGEIRDLVIEQPYRQKGIARHLLTLALELAQKLDYRRLYLETTPEMEKAQKLFLSMGFLPVVDRQKKTGENQNDLLPCYFVLEVADVNAQKA